MPHTERECWLAKAFVWHSARFFCIILKLLLTAKISLFCLKKANSIQILLILMKAYYAARQLARHMEYKLRPQKAAVSFKCTSYFFQFYRMEGHYAKICKMQFQSMSWATWKTWFPIKPAFRVLRCRIWPQLGLWKKKSPWAWNRVTRLCLCIFLSGAEVYSWIVQMANTDKHALHFICRITSPW